MARNIFKGLDKLVEGYHTEEGRRKPKKQIKEAKTRTEIRLGDKVYPIKDKEFLKGKVASYGNEHGLEHVRTVKYSDGTSYKIYDSGFGNFGHVDACAVLIEKLKGDVPPKGYEKPTSVKGDWIWDEVRYDWYDRDTGSYYAEIESKVTDGKLKEALYGKKELDEFITLCDKLGLKTFGDLKDFADNNKNRILVNDLLKDYDSFMSTDAFFQTLRDRVAESGEFEYDNPLHVIKNRKNESLQLTEGHENYDYKGFTIDLDDDQFHNIKRHGSGNVTVEIKLKDEVYATVNGYDAAEEWIDKNGQRILDEIKRKEEEQQKKDKQSNLKNNLKEVIAEYRQQLLEYANTIKSGTNRFRDDSYTPSVENFIPVNEIDAEFFDGRDQIDINLDKLRESGKFISKDGTKEREAEELLLQDGLWGLSTYEGHIDTVMSMVPYIDAYNNREVDIMSIDNFEDSRCLGGWYTEISPEVESLFKVIQEQELQGVVKHDIKIHITDPVGIYLSSDDGCTVFSDISKDRNPSLSNMLTEDLIHYIEDNYQSLLNEYSQQKTTKNESLQLTEGHQVREYKGFTLDLDEDSIFLNIDEEEGDLNPTDLLIDIKLDGKTIHQEKGFRRAREWVDKNGEEIKHKELLAHIDQTHGIIYDASDDDYDSNMVTGIMEFENIKCDSKMFVEFILKKLGHKELNEEHSTISIKDAINIGTLTYIYCTLDYFPDDNIVNWSFILDEDWDNILAFTDRALTKLIVKHNNKVYFPNDVAGDSFDEMEEAISKFLKSTINESLQLTEDHKVQNYKGFELDWDTDEIDDEEGIASFNVYIRYNGKELHTAHGFRQAREWVDKNGDKYTIFERTIQKCLSKLKNNQDDCDLYIDEYEVDSWIAVNNIKEDELIKALIIGTGGLYSSSSMKKNGKYLLPNQIGDGLYLHYWQQVSYDDGEVGSMSLQFLNADDPIYDTGDIPVVGYYKGFDEERCSSDKTIEEKESFIKSTIVANKNKIASEIINQSWKAGGYTDEDIIKYKEIVENSWKNSHYSNYNGIYEALVQEDSIKIKDLSSVKEIQKDDKSTWADKECAALMKKGKPNWDESDWETYHYIQQLRFDSGYYSESLKEEYGPYKDNEIIRAIGDQIADGNDYGSAYDRDWELTIQAEGGEVIENENISSDFYSRLLVDISYPVLDGHLDYYGLNILLYGVPATKEELEFLGFTDEDIERYLKAKDFEEEIETWIDYEITYDGPDIRDEFDSDEDFDDDILDESKNDSILSKDIVEEVRSEILRGLDIPDDWFSHPDYLVDDGSGYQFYTVRVIDGDLARQIELFINNNYKGVDLVAFDAETNELLDTYEGSSELNISVFVNSNEFKDLTN